MTSEQTSPEAPADVGPRVLFEGDDVEALDEMVTSEFSAHRLRVGRVRAGQARFHRIHRQGLALYELAWGADIEVAAGALPDFYNLHIPLIGDGTVWVEGHEVASACSIAGPGQTLGMSLAAKVDTLIIFMPRTAVDEAVAARTGESPTSTVRFDAALADGDPAIRAWLHTARTFAEFAASPLATRSPLATAHFERTLVHGLVDIQPHNLTVRLPTHDRRMLPSALRRAIAYCEEHAGEPVSVADIAAAARVSVRTLQDRFRSDLGTTPAAYLRRVRLDGAHQDLKRIGVRSSGAVTEVATRWGFTHLGRFAASYEAVYGEKPSQTIQGHEGIHG